jgi:hypothetical protein
MMTRTRTGLSAAVLTATALLLAACGGDSGGDDGIPGAGGGQGQQEPQDDPEPEPENEPVSPEDDVDRPDVTLPEHMTNVFEAPETTDERELAVIADAQLRRSGIDAAIDAGDVEHPALAFYAARTGLIDTITYVAGFTEIEYTWSGTARYYDWQVEDGDTDEAATLTYCMDQSRAFDMDSSGEVAEREPDVDVDYVLFHDRLERNELGVWQLVQTTPERGADRCLP